MPLLFRDYETASPLDLGDVGTWQYAIHPETRVWCCAYAVDDGPVKLWVPGNTIPPEILEAADDPTYLLSAFNNSFERLIEQHIMAPRFGWPIIPLDRHRCSQAVALSYALPARLEQVAQVLGLANQKDVAGSKVMKKWAKPRKPRRGEDRTKVYWCDDPREREQLFEYCRQDLRVERELSQRLGELSENEQTLFQLDAVINDRGFYTDGNLIGAAIRVSAAFEAEVNAEIAKVTDGTITCVSQSQRLLAWLRSHDCRCDDIQKTTLRRLLKRSDIALEARQVIELRLEGAHAAAAKPDAFTRWRGSDGRVRGAFKYHAAHTGRWASFGIQVQNLKRATLADLGAAVTAITTDTVEQLRQTYPQTLDMVSSLARAMICARSGHKLIAADFSGIESRVTAWLSKQQSKIDQWAKFDRTQEPKDEPYYITGSKYFRLPEEHARSIGKTGDLAFGYMGSVGAWKKLAGADDTTPDATIEQYKHAWRDAHPKTVAFWYALDRAARRAVQYPDKIIPCGRVSFVYDQTFLFMQLPSGRRLSYPFPRLVTNGRNDRVIVHKVAREGKWTDYRFGNGAYGGTWIENAVQAVARDLFAAAMPRLEAAGYPIVLHVHDEIVCEVPIDFGDEEQFRQLMIAPAPWADGLPLAAKVRTGDRFCKIDKPIETSADSEEPPEAFTTPPEKAPAETSEEETFEEEPEPASSNGDEDARAPDTEEDGQGNGSTREDARNSGTGYPHGENESGRKVAAYIYCDSKGAPYLKVVKRVPKQGRKYFPQYHWENGRWILGKPNGPPIPYRLPELLAAPADEPVWICEGEKDAENVAALGLIATTNPEGATMPDGVTGKWQPELNQWFKGRKLVYIVEDNDVAGRAHTAKIIENLRDLVVEIVVVAFPELPEHHDLADWLEAGGNKELLLARAEEARKRTSAAPKITPIDLWAKFDPPPLPRGVLPKVIEDFAFAQGELMGADPAGLAVAGLTVCGAAIPDHIELQVKEHDGSWRECTRLWIALVGDPSRKKTPILRQAARPLNRIDAELARTYAEELAAYQQLSADERKITEPPKKRRLRVEDTTIEAAQHILKDSPNGVLSIQDELSGSFGAMEKYSSARGSAKDRGFWLQSWNGGSYVSDRIGRGTVYIPNLSVSLIGGIQPASMRKVIEDTVDDGLIQRLNPVMLRPATVGKDDERPDATKQYEALVTWLAEEPAPALTVKFASGAQAIRRKLEQRHLDLTTCEGFSAKLAAHLGKYDGIFARLCLIWHCLETENWDRPISEDIAARVERFLHGFLLPHAVAFYASMGSDNHDRLADVSGYILAHNLQVITNRDLARSVRSTKGLAALEVREVFEALDALGWLTPVPSPQPRSPPRWKVNPECHRLFSARAEAERGHREKAREIMQEIFSKPKEGCQ